MESLFPANHGEIKHEMISVKCRLREAAVLIFYDLENSIKSETRKTLMFELKSEATPNLVKQSSGCNEGDAHYSHCGDLRQCLGYNNV
ncbi:hypothetical protein JHK82_045092 [Glycine max]|nr:hypothetical protein JHK82_045092 [Glycine max]